MSDYTPPTPTEGQTEEARDAANRRRFNLRGRSLREHAARGTLINTAFLVSLSFLGFLKGFILAGFLAQSDYGIWGITIVTLNIISRLQAVGIGDKFIQQDEDNQEEAFQKAFTLYLGTGVISMALSFAVLPIFVQIYGQQDILLPGLLLALNWLIAPFQMPLWVHYRRMEFLRQRVLSSLDPIVSFIVAISLAVAGAGYWALFIGAVSGPLATSIAASVTSPFKYRLRYDSGTMREYWRFSGPLMLAGFGGLVIAQTSLLVTEIHLGIAAVGALTLASTISQFTDRVDQLVTGTLYPAVVAVKDKMDVLYESFVKSNRLALMWAVPFGVGISLFCGDLVEFAIGERWRSAVPLLQMFGVIAAIGHIGFNWDAYFRARAETKPMAVAAGVAAGTFLLVGIPLMLTFDMRGLAIAVGLQMLAHVAVRAFYLSRLFDGFTFLPHALRAVLPSLPPIAVVLLLRAVETGERTVWMAVGEMVLYLAITAAATWWMEKPLLREVAGYVRRPRTAEAPA